VERFGAAFDEYSERTGYISSQFLLVQIRELNGEKM
jgi:hypothetical protein